METNERAQHIVELMLKRITQSISKAESEELEKWRATRKQNEAAYRRCMDYAFLEMEYKSRKAIDIAKPMEEMQRRITSMESRKRKTTIWRIAAAAVFIGITMLCVWNVLTPKEQLPHEAGIVPGHVEATIRKGTGEAVKLGSDAKKNKEILDLMASAEKGTPMEISTPRGGEFKVTLDDGTEIWLNAQSKVIYPDSFDESERRIKVDGEVYLKVAHDIERPFYVETGGQVVRVLGTEFNIKSYEEDKDIYTTLVNGSISLSSADTKDAELILSPGHQASFNKQTHSANVSQVDTYVTTSWRHGKFVFQDQSLEKIMQSLSRWYDFDFIFEDESLKNTVFMGSVPRSSDFTHVLSMLEKSGGLHFKVDGKKVIIKNK
ncbi:MAG: FecR family protein [Prevotella sp.]